MSTSSEIPGQAFVPAEAERIAEGAVVNETGPLMQEQATSSAENAPKVSQVPAMTLPPIQMPGMAITPTTTQSQTDVSTTTPSITAGIIEDSDLIEKEWVHKAKSIVEANREDPYKQSEELTGVKADYMKKRYNKNIKLK